MKTTQTTEGILIKVKVKPRSNNFKMEREEDNLVVHCRNPPEKGKANKELIKELSKLLGHEVFIVSGLTSKEKIILIKDAEPNELNSLLAKQL
ncbi:MAG TPA: DUF167 domain-containing protein [Candidatus Krumholzibacteriaceae bacterium]|jgi:uncharacterized protein (TIGR00251 family)|nr:DUF167 domain-containing protein [Candidatus Krumholzibacteriaceae bacterium]